MQAWQVSAVNDLIIIVGFSNDVAASLAKGWLLLEANVTCPSLREDASQLNLQPF